MSKFCLEVAVKLLCQPEDVSRVGASKGVNHLGMNTQTEEEEEEEEEEGNREGRGTDRGMGDQRVNVVGQLRESIEDSSARGIVKGPSADPDWRSGLEPRGARFKLVGSQENHAVRGPFSRPVGDIPVGLWGLDPEGVRYPPGRGDIGVNLQLSPIDLVPGLFQGCRGIVHCVVDRARGDRDREVVQVGPKPVVVSHLMAQVVLQERF